jgi:hypothetical protein
MAEALPGAPSTLSHAAAVGDSRHRRWFFVSFYALAVLWGIRSIYHTQPSALDLLVPIALAVCLGWWALTDARRRRHPIPRTAQPWFFLLAVPVVPGYVVWSRGWRGLGWVALHTLLWYVVATVALHLGGLMVYGEAWLRALGL